MDITEGRTFVPGRDRETAIRLLAAADELGYAPEVVRAISGGYDVPTDVAKRSKKVDVVVPPKNEVGSAGAAPKAAGTAEEVIERLDGEFNTPNEFESQPTAQDDGVLKAAIISEVDEDDLTDEDKLALAAQEEREEAEKVAREKAEQDAKDAEEQAKLDAEAKAKLDAEAEEKAEADRKAAEAVKLTEPAGNASAETWLAYAKEQATYNEATDAELGRDDLKAKFGSK